MIKNRTLCVPEQSVLFQTLTSVEVASINALLEVEHPLVVLHQAAQFLCQLQSHVLEWGGLGAVHHHRLCRLVEWRLLKEEKEYLMIIIIKKDKFTFLDDAEIQFTHYRPHSPLILHWWSFYWWCCEPWVFPTQTSETASPCWKTEYQDGVSFNTVEQWSRMLARHVWAKH